MNNPIRIIIADDYPLFLEGIQLMLEADNRIVVCGVAQNGAELVALTHALQPDVVLTDVEMPEVNGIEATRKIKAFNSKIGILALTMFGEAHLLSDMIEAGANGYILKSSRKEIVLEGIFSAHAGGYYFCPGTSATLNEIIMGRKKSSQSDNAIPFTEHETVIIQCICKQYASKEIAVVTGLSFRTVEKYRLQIMQKIGARNLAGIVVYAMQHGLYKP